MTEKLFAFLFAGILGAMFYHLVAAMIFRRYFGASPAALAHWYIPLIVVPGLLLGLLAWFLGFGRRSSSWWGNLLALASIAVIVICTVGAPYNCWNEICF